MDDLIWICFFVSYKKIFFNINFFISRRLSAFVFRTRTARRELQQITKRHKYLFDNWPLVSSAVVCSCPELQPLVSEF